MNDTPKREPLLSDAEIHSRSWVDYAFGGVGAFWTAKAVRDHYENLIDTGVLMVVKTVKRNLLNSNIGECDLCRKFYVGADRFCPGCGARIVE